jgi:hypothetical protein
MTYKLSGMADGAPAQEGARRGEASVMTDAAAPGCPGCPAACRGCGVARPPMRPVPIPSRRDQKSMWTVTIVPGSGVPFT